MSAVDLSDAIAPASDQLDNIELATGPRVFVIERVEVRGGEQPVQIFLADFPRPWRPAKTMTRLLVLAWGKDAKEWVGRKVRLYRDPDVPFGNTKPGGTRISGLSHIAARRTFELPYGKSGTKRFTVEPLPDEPTRPTPSDDIDTMTDRDALRALWKTATDEQKARITARVAALDAVPDDNPLHYMPDEIGEALA